jgi:hypothetical protein
LERATGIDVAGAIVEHAVAFAGRERNGELSRGVLF